MNRELSPRSIGRLAARGLVALSIVAAGVAVGPPAARAEVAVLTVQGEWTGGYTLAAAVTNDTEATLGHWRLMFFLPAGTRIAAWTDSYVAQHGNRWVVTGIAGLSTPMAPGRTATAALIMSGTGKPYACTINGAPCIGGAATGDVSPPTRPTHLQVTVTARGERYLQWTQSTDDTGVHQYMVELRRGTSGRERQLIAPWTFTPTRIYVTDLTGVHTVIVSARDAAFNYSQPTSISITP